MHPEKGSDDLSYFFGSVVESFDFIPVGMVTLEIPAAKYAVFSVDADSEKMSRREYIDAIKNTWKYIFREWFDQSGYCHNCKVLMLYTLFYFSHKGILSIHTF